IGGGHNIHPVVTNVAVGTIKESRQLRMQPFNEYRKRFNLRPYTSFRQFSANEEIALELEELYGDIDALEFYPGLMLGANSPGGPLWGEHGGDGGPLLPERPPGKPHMTCPYVAFRIPAEETEPEGDSKERTDEL
ncbi:hypothetical protein KUCAC02_032556, partial [Chaenocephalus aceratus]